MVIRSFISALLLVVFLLGNLWIPVYTHTCKLFNVSEITILQGRTCCDISSDSSTDTRVTTTNCCSLKVESVKSIENGITNEISDLINITSASFTLPVTTFHFEVETFRSSLQVRPPPSAFTIASFQILFQVFRI